jgi:hypothetical protein
VKRGVKISAIIVWLVLATLSLAYVWGNNPDAFPRPPESVAVWLLKLDGSQLAQAEIHYLFAVSFMTVVICTLLAMLVWKHIPKPHNK